MRREYLMKFFLLFVLIFSSLVRADDFFCRKAMEAYDECNFNCSKILISSYTSTLYSHLNQTLRNNIDDQPVCLEAADKLYKAIKKISRSKLTVYRGTVVTKEMKLLKADDCYFDKGFMSTSGSMEIAKKFGLKQGMMIIEAKSARDISKYSNIPREQEFILLPGTPLKLVQTSTENSLKVFYFKEVDRKNCF